MKRGFFYLILFFVLNTQGVFAAYITEPKDPFELPILENIEGETVYGKLVGFPHTFTFVVTEDTAFSMQASMNAKNEQRDVSLILVKQEKRGVSEIGRITGNDVQWNEKYDIWRALWFALGPSQSYTLTSGTYRLEVSAPDNNRSYRLLLGTGDSSLPKEIFMIRKVFDVSIWSVFLSPFVFGFIVLSLGLIYLRKRKKV